MKRLFASILISAAGLSPASAAAGEPEWKIQQRRQILFDEGVKLVEKEQYREALGRFRDVIRLRHHPRVYLWIALCEDKLGDPIKARAIYAHAQQSARERKLDDVASDAVSAIAEITPRIPRLVIHTDAPGPLLVLLDSARVPLQDGRPVEVNPGKHTLIVGAVGRTSYHARIELKPGEEKVVNAPLPELLPEPGVPRATVPIAGIVAASGGVVLLASGGACAGIGYRSDNSSLKAGGWVQIAVGAALAGAGIGWAISEQRSAGKAGSTSLRSSISLAAAPLPGGVWSGVGGTFF